MKLARAAAALTAAAALCAVAAPASAQNIDTTGGFDFCNISSPGGGATAFGQTFTPNATQAGIASFAFEFANAPSTMIFRGEIYAWDPVNSRAIGPSLYNSGAVSTSGPARQVLTFTPSAIVPLTVNQPYVILISTVQDAGTGFGCVTAQGNDPIVGAQHYIAATSRADLTTQTWSSNGPLQDYGVRIAFASPEPVPTLSEWAMILFGTALAGGAAVYLQRRRLTA